MVRMLPAEVVKDLVSERASVGLLIAGEGGIFLSNVHS